MKTFCIIILFASVNVLLAVLDYTTKQIILTNKYIDLAEDRLPSIIFRIVNGNYSMEKIAVMLAVPEAVNDDPKPNRILRLQGNMRTEIRKALGCPHSSLIDINETDFQGVTIRDLGRARRRKTREAIITLIRELIKVYHTRIHIQKVVFTTRELVICYLYTTILACTDPLMVYFGKST
ncbi:uncharacterized protein LOC126835599 isoform X3 [Adelges cooleyi]|uniref:uncharacterized protein LOC126835599 isoform X3 n=1 Tax=Adelges cooleyi TaxID=133065 RepID=UPI0021805682|nr:uncharacterized protein LOC126835599 isoform X3 [Adelges cooleyi]